MVTKDLRCNNCKLAIDPASIDTQRELASCGNCGRLMDLRRVRSAAPEVPEVPDTTGKERARPPVQLPAGMSLTTAAEVIIRRRWLRGKHWFLLVLFAAAAAYVGHLWSTAGASAWLIIGTLFVLNLNYTLAAMFLNSTVVTAGAGGVNVRHGPLPSLFARNAAAEKSNIEQLYAANHGAMFAVLAKLRSGQTLRLVAPLATAEQAMFIEQQLERRLGLADFAVEGELESSAVRVDGKRPAGAVAGAALAFVIPAFIAAMLGLFYLVARTEVSGQLNAKGALGSWAFAPDDCTSGQREGFGGVVLTASAQPERLVRVVRDPVRGNLVVVATKGQPNHVLTGGSCTRFDVNAERTSTNINDIWVVDGSLSIECSELSGSVKFEGCH